VIVRRHRVAAASCFLPLTLNPRLSRELGTRHRAALGVTEDTDAVAVVVSEESGLISIVQRGEIKRGLDAPKLRAAISQALDIVPKREKEREQDKSANTETETEEIASV
jgi:diadenylate cyclase